jgi:hypothetical protein
MWGQNHLLSQTNMFSLFFVQNLLYSAPVLLLLAHRHRELMKSVGNRGSADCNFMHDEAHGVTLCEWQSQGLGLVILPPNQVLLKNFLFNLMDMWLNYAVYDL